SGNAARDAGPLRFEPIRTVARLTRPRQVPKFPSRVARGLHRPLRGVPAQVYGMERRSMKTVFTTGEAAEICKVSQQTIIRCFDSGRLKGFRVPGSRFRRIPLDALVAFMKENGIPVDALNNGKRRVLVVDDDPEIVELFVDVLERDGRFE